MKKRFGMMAAMLLMAGVAFAQQPEPAKQEASATAEMPAGQEQAAESAKEEKAGKDGENKGDCTNEKCGSADSSSSDTTAEPAK